MTDETALIPTDGGERGLLRRGPDGLMLIQRHFLQELAVQGSWRKACQTLDIKERRVRGWLDEETFATAYDNLYGAGDLEATKQELGLLSAQAAALYEETLTAMQGVKEYFTCHKCGEKNEVDSLRPDWRVRLKAMDTLLKISGLLKDTKRVEGGTTNYNVKLTGDEMMSLIAYRAGRQIPASAVARLRECGMLD